MTRQIPEQLIKARKQDMRWMGLNSLKYASRKDIRLLYAYADLGDDHFLALLPYDPKANEGAVKFIGKYMQHPEQDVMQPLI